MKTPILVLAVAMTAAASAQQSAGRKPMRDAAKELAGQHQPIDIPPPARQGTAG